MMLELGRELMVHVNEGFTSVFLPVLGATVNNHQKKFIINRNSPASSIFCWAQFKKTKGTNANVGDFQIVPLLFEMGQSFEIQTFAREWQSCSEMSRCSQWKADCVTHTKGEMRCFWLIAIRTGTEMISWSSASCARAASEQESELSLEWRISSFEIDTLAAGWHDSPLTGGCTAQLSQNTKRSC